MVSSTSNFNQIILGSLSTIVLLGGSVFYGIIHCRRYLSSTSNGVSLIPGSEDLSKNGNKHIVMKNYQSGRQSHMNQNSEIYVIGPNKREVIVFKPSHPLVIAPPIRESFIVNPTRLSYWEECGWIREQKDGENEYKGKFSILDIHSGRKKAFSGRLIERGNIVTLYIYKPPNSLLRDHPKRVCLKHQNNDCFKLHWGHPARHPDEAILYMERILAESINLRHP